MSRIESRVVVCRGCCCGTEQKHPDVDHDGQLRALRSGLGHHAVQVIRCFGRCEKSNVMVVMPSRAGRSIGGRPTWFGSMLFETAVDELAGWIDAGGPGVAPVPHALESHRITPPVHGRSADSPPSGQVASTRAAAPSP